MFFRNLFFIVLVLGGAATLVANLIPPKHGFKPTPTNPEVFQENDFIETDPVESLVSKLPSNGVMNSERKKTNRKNIEERINEEPKLAKEKKTSKKLKSKLKEWNLGFDITIQSSLNLYF